MNRQTPHIDFLDYLRGIAILGVFLFHAMCFFPDGGQLPWGTWLRDFPQVRSFLLFLPLSFGWAGVPLFFVLSGFCIHLSLTRSRRPNFIDFYLRRFFRIYPPYFIALMGFAIALPLSGHSFSDRATIVSLLSYVSLVQNFDPYDLQINGSYWTIAIEVQLYLIYPVLLWLVGKLGWRRTLFGLAAVELCLRLMAPALEFGEMQSSPIDWLGSTPLRFWYSWSIGAWLADAFLRKQPLPFGRSRLWVWWSLALLTYWVKPFSDLPFTLFAVLTATYIAKLLNGEMQFALPQVWLRSLRWIGLWSYSIYLLHQPLMYQFVHIFTNLSPTLTSPAIVRFLLAVASGVLIFPLSVLFYRYWELPSITFGKQAIKRLQRA